MQWATNFSVAQVFTSCGSALLPGFYNTGYSVSDVPVNNGILGYSCVDVVSGSGEMECACCGFPASSALAVPLTRW